MSLADRLAKAQQKDRIAEVRVRVQERLVESLGPRSVRRDPLRHRARGHGAPAPARSSSTRRRTARGAGEAADRPSDRRQRPGPRSARAYIRDPEVTEVMVNNWDTIYVERAGKLFWTGTKFHDEGQLRRTIDKIVAKVAAPRRRGEPDGGRASPRRLPCERDHPALDRRPSSRSGSSPPTRTRPTTWWSSDDELVRCRSSSRRASVAGSTSWWPADRRRERRR